MGTEEILPASQPLMDTIEVPRNGNKSRQKKVSSRIRYFLIAALPFSSSASLLLPAVCFSRPFAFVSLCFLVLLLSRPFVFSSAASRHKSSLPATQPLMGTEEVLPAKQPLMDTEEVLPANQPLADTENDLEALSISCVRRVSNIFQTNVRHVFDKCYTCFRPIWLKHASTIKNHI